MNHPQNNSAKAATSKQTQKSGGSAKQFPLSIKLMDTGEVFHLKGIQPTTTILELKNYLEFATGIPKSLQQIHYLDEGDLMDNTDIRFNDVVPGGQLHMRIWHTWVPLIKAVTQNNINKVLQLGVTPDSTYRTPNSEYMSAKARQSWLAERAFIALYIACHRGHNQLVKTLIEAGADVNMMTTLGRTPLHVAAAQDRGNIVDVLLNSGADVNEVDKSGESALAIAEKFGHKDGARHLFLFRWQVRAKQAKKCQDVPLYYHQQCDTSYPVWFSGNQAQIYYAQGLPEKEFIGGTLGANPITKKPSEVPTDERVKQKIPFDKWLGEKQKIDDEARDKIKAVKAAKKLEEEKKKEQNLIDKESFDTWVKKQQEEKERAELRKKVKQQQQQLQSKGATKPQQSTFKAAGSTTTKTNEPSERADSADPEVKELQAFIKSTNRKAVLTYDDLIFQDEHETFDKVKNVQMKRAGGKNAAIVPMLLS